MIYRVDDTDRCLKLNPRIWPENRKPEWGSTSESSGVIVRFSVVDKECQSRQSETPDLVRKLTDEIALFLDRKEVFLAQMRKLAGELNSSQTAVMGGVGRVALRQLYGLALGGGG